MGRRRVFILGAGFSKPAGMPLATELTTRILERPLLEEFDELQAYVADLRRRLALFEGAAADEAVTGLNVEQLFDFAKYDAELWRMRQQLARVSRHSGATPWSQAESIEAWLEYMEQELVHVVWSAQKHADLGPIKNLTSQLSLDDVVVTFNYDTLVECALTAEGRAWNHGLMDRPNGGVTVLKMHGSIDWLGLGRRPEQQLEKFVKLFSKVDLDVSEFGHDPPKEPEYAWELWRAKDPAAGDAVLEMDRTGLGCFDYVIGVAGLGRYKPLHRLPGSARTWLSAFKALAQAEEVYVVGFSMSPYDTMSRFHFTTIIRQRAEPPSRVAIVDPNAARLASTFRSVFGEELELIARGAEEVDWPSLLG